MPKNVLRVVSKFNNSFVISLGIHILVLSLLLVTFNHNKPQPSIKVNLHPNPANQTIIKAKMIDKRAVDQALKRQQQIVEEQRRMQEAQKEKELAQQRAIEQEKQRQIEQELATKKAAQEKARMELAQKQMQKELAVKKKLEVQQKQLQQKQLEQKQAQQKLVQQKQLEQKQVQEKLAQQKLAQQKAEQQQLARQQAQAKEQQIAGLKAQQERLVTAENAAFIASEVERYTAVFKAAIEDNRILSAVFKGDMRCKLRIKLLPDGSILSVSVVESSGNTAYDEMSQAAVHKTAPFPMPEDHELYARLRDIVLSFKNGEQAEDVS